MEPSGRWAPLEYLLTRPGNVVGPGFEPGPEVLEFLREHCKYVKCIHVIDFFRSCTQ